jgi:hypothetical protein
MAKIRPMSPMDMLKFNPCNLDHLTETYNISFYLDYFRQWPHLCKVIEGPTGQIEAYSRSFCYTRAYSQTDVRSQSSARLKPHRILPQ